MTAPDRYDRPDPCPDCGEPVCRCGDDWPEEDDERVRWSDVQAALVIGQVRSWDEVDIDRVGPADYGLRAVRDLRVDRRWL